jgi:diguanylate cyclase (GGDEF)-like protein/PAS domain S-box-containing protein
VLNSAARNAEVLGMSTLTATSRAAFPRSPVLDDLADGILATDADLDRPGGPRVVYANRAFSEITGYPVAEILGASPKILQGPDTDPAVMVRLHDDLRAGRPFAGQTTNYRKDGAAFTMEWSIAAIPGADGQPAWFVAVQRDATLPARRLLDAQREARIDPLTGLPNRRHCDDILAGGAWLSSRARSALVIDLDHFKAINDTKGHLVGDDVLREVGRRLRGVVREGDLVARWGGEEFCVLTLEGSAGAEGLAERLRETIASEPCPTSAGPVWVTASVGFAAVRGGIVAAQALLAAADQAMYTAKRSGRNRVCM